jgi:SNF2 family DNA or RNA helicase
LPFSATLSGSKQALSSKVAEYNGTVTDNVKRAKILEEFRNPTSGQQILLITAGAGGVGVNITQAQHVVIVDSFWDPSQDDEAICRVLRIDHEGSVYIHRLGASRSM